MKKPPRNVGPRKVLPIGKSPGDHLARLVYAKRMRMGITSVGALAEASGLSQNRVKAIEKGVMPGQDDLRKICRALHIKPADLKS